MVPLVGYAPCTRYWPRHPAYCLITSLTAHAYGIVITASSGLFFGAGMQFEFYCYYYENYHYSVARSTPRVSNYYYYDIIICGTCAYWPYSANTAYRQSPPEKRRQPHAQLRERQTSLGVPYYGRVKNPQDSVFSAESMWSADAPDARVGVSGRSRQQAATTMEIFRS